MVLSLLPAASRLKSSCRTTCRSTSRNPSPAKAATSNKAINASRQYCADRTAVVSGLCFSCFKSRAQVKRRFGAPRIVVRPDASTESVWLPASAPLATGPVTCVSAGALGDCCDPPKKEKKPISIKVIICSAAIRAAPRFLLATTRRIILAIFFSD